MRIQPSTITFTSLLTLTLCLLLSHTSLTTAKKSTSPSSVPKNAILLSKVSTLTLRSGRSTTHRRVSAVPQLTCIGSPSICSLYTIDTMRCTNEGADYDAENIQWACHADLPEEFKLGSTDVMCEGYESSEDPYVLKGSCAVEYRLLLTEKGEMRFGKGYGGDDGDSWFGRGGGSEGGESGLLAKIVFFAIFGVVLFVILSGLVNACRRNPPRLGGGEGRGGDGRPPWFGGGGGGEDGFDDPPPPYDSHGWSAPPKKTGTRTNTRTGTGTARQSRGNSTQGQQQQQGWRPGPWTAGLAGAGLGYVLGRGQNTTRAPVSPRPNTRQGGFFGDGGGPSRSSSSMSSSPPTFSSSRHQSTGFGGTSRR